MNTYKITGKRFQRLYTAASPTSTYSAPADAATISNVMCTVPWTQVPTDVVPVHPPHSGNETTDQNNVANRNCFDAAMFCSDHDEDAGTHIARAQVTCYRMTLPETGLVLRKLRIGVSCDPYTQHGARIAMFTNNTGVVPEACSACRKGSAPSDSHSCVNTGSTWKSNDTYAEGVAPRTTGDDGYWYTSMGTAVLAPEGGLTLGKYLFVFVCLEQYYVRPNSGYLEGSAILQAPFMLTVDGTVETWDEAGGGSGEESDASDDSDASGEDDGSWIDAGETIDCGDADPSAIGFDGFQVMATGSAPEYEMPGRFALVGRAPFTGAVMPDRTTVPFYPAGAHEELLWGSDDSTAEDGEGGWPTDKGVLDTADVIGSTPFTYHYLMGTDLGGLVVSYDKTAAAAFAPTDADPKFKVDGLRFFYAWTESLDLDETNGPAMYEMREVDYIMSTMGSDSSEWPEFVRWMKAGQVTAMFLTPAFSHGSTHYSSGETFRTSVDKVAFAFVVVNGVLKKSVVAGYFVCCNGRSVVLQTRTAEDMGNTHWRFFTSNKTGSLFDGCVVAVHNRLNYYMSMSNVDMCCGNDGSSVYSSEPPFPSRAIDSEVAFTESVQTITYSDSDDDTEHNGTALYKVNLNIDIKDSRYLLDNYAALVVAHETGDNTVEIRAPKIMSTLTCVGKNIVARCPDDISHTGIPYLAGSVMVITGDLESVGGVSCEQVAYADIFTTFGVSTPPTVFVPGMDGDIPVARGTPFDVYFYPIRYNLYARSGDPTTPDSTDWKWRARSGVALLNDNLGFLTDHNMYALIVSREPMTVSGTLTNAVWAVCDTGITGTYTVATSFTLTGVPQMLQDVYADWFRWVPVARGWYAHFRAENQIQLEKLATGLNNVYGVTTGGSAFSRAGACIGLRNCYADFFDSSDSESGDLDPSSTSGAVGVVRAFSLTRLVTTDGGNTRQKLSTPVWMTAVSPLIVPFSAPVNSYNATKVKLDWATTNVPVGMKFIVWLLRGTRMKSYTQELHNRSFYCGDVTAVGKWERVGIADGANGTATFTFENPLKCRVGTFMLTAWVQQDYMNPEDVIAAGTTSVEFSRGVGSITELDLDTDRVQVSQTNGWRPSVTLLED